MFRAFVSYCTVALDRLPQKELCKGKHLVGNCLPLRMIAHSLLNRAACFCVITEPTRIAESWSTLIDLFYTNCVDGGACSGVSHIGISDHSLIYVYTKLSLASFSTGHSTISYVMKCNVM